jgi:cytochrome c oxidase assembly protein subunit 11
MSAAPNRNRNLRVAALAAGVAVSMVGLAYASVPLYRIFCQVTGFGGTPQRAASAPANPAEKTIVIRFDANVAAKLGWQFGPEQLEMKVKVGEQALAYYRATNRTSEVREGSATFNVTPPAAGAFFNKIECFCFTRQKLNPGESVELPVAFFVDPAILEDPDTRSIDTITLSYTFYPVEKPETATN